MDCGAGRQNVQTDKLKTNEEELFSALARVLVALMSILSERAIGECCTQYSSLILRGEPNQRPDISSSFKMISTSFFLGD